MKTSTKRIIQANIDHLDALFIIEDEENDITAENIWEAQNSVILLIQDSIKRFKVTSQEFDTEFGSYFQHLDCIFTF